MKNLIQIFCLAGIFLFSSIEASFSQADESAVSEKYYWISSGFGAGSVADGSVSFYSAIKYQSGKHVLTLRTVASVAFFERSMSDCGLLYGLSAKYKSLYASAGAGLAFVEGSIGHGLFSNIKPTQLGPTIGIPLEAQLAWQPLPFLGICLNGFANLNSVETFCGFTVNLQIGKLR